MSVGQINITQTLDKVEDLLRQDQSMSSAARTMFELLVTIIHLLVAKLGLNSSNSSIPPSQDPRRKRGAKSKGNGRKRKPGGQKGHTGTTLEPVDDPDQIENIAVDRRTIPRGQYKNAGYEVRQVIDIIITKFVIEYRAEILEDAHGRQFVAQFPAGVTRPVQYGQGVKVQAVYTSQQQLIPYDRIRDYFWDQCGIPISPGSIFRFNQEAYALLEPFESFLVGKLVQQSLLHADETGIHINKTLYWLHCLCNEKWTLFFPHAKRGSDAIKTMGVLEHFHGRLGHDHWKTYFQFDCIHFLCNAHHVRELEHAWIQDGQWWALKMQSLLLETGLPTGGLRAWFLCPGCGRRCGRLYLSNDTRMPDYRCRLCLGLAYDIQYRRGLRAEIIRMFRKWLSQCSQRSTSPPSSPPFPPDCC